MLIILLQIGILIFFKSLAAITVILIIITKTALKALQVIRDIEF